MIIAYDFTRIMIHFKNLKKDKNNSLTSGNGCQNQNTEMKFLPSEMCGLAHGKLQSQKNLRIFLLPDDYPGFSLNAEYSPSM